MSKYTFEVCKELANNCKSRTEMSQKHSMAYKMSCRNKWIDLFFPLKRRRLTFDVCKEKAKNFSTRAEFLKADESMYKICQTNGWLTIFFGSQQINRTKGTTIYDYETCKQLASGCKNRYEMKVKYPRAFVVSSNNNWCEDFFGKKCGRELTYEFCKTVAQQVSSRQELYTKDMSVYSKSLKMGWLDTFFLEKEYSVLERRIINFCEDHLIKYYYRTKRFSWLTDKRRMELDFYLPDYCVAIECQGIQHFEVRDFLGGEDNFNETIRRDILKNKLCSEHNVKLLYYTTIDYTNYGCCIYNNSNTYDDLNELFNVIINN